MKMTQTLLAAAIALVPMTAMAGGSIDAFYIDNEIDDGANKEDGDGFGFRGQAELGNGFSVTGLYQNSDVSGSGTTTDITETRVGVSYLCVMNKQFSLTTNVETVQVDLTDSGLGVGLDGYSAGIRADLAIVDNLSAYAKVAYTDLGDVAGDDVNGAEYEVGALFSINKNLGAFVEYRIVDLDIDPNDELQLDTLRVGGRYTF
ncbi:MAG: porin [Pseudomonadota bacterium]